MYTLAGYAENQLTINIQILHFLFFECVTCISVIAQFFKKGVGVFAICVIGVTHLRPSPNQITPKVAFYLLLFYLPENLSIHMASASHMHLPIGADSLPVAR